MGSKRKCKGASSRGHNMPKLMIVEKIYHGDSTTGRTTTAETTGSPSHSDMDEPQIGGYIKVDLDSGFEAGVDLKLNNEPEYLGSLSNPVPGDIDIGEVEVKLLQEKPEYEIELQSEDEGGHTTNVIDNDPQPRKGLHATASKSSKRTFIVEQPIAMSTTGTLNQKKYDKFTESHSVIEVLEPTNADALSDVAVPSERTEQHHINGSSKGLEESFLSASRDKATLSSPVSNKIRLAADFAVNSNGHCFFCLDKIATVKVEPGLEPAEPVPSPKYSARYLSRLLKLDMRKVINGMCSGHITSHLLTKVERSKTRLVVELCEGCAYLNRRLSELCRHLEKLEMEVGSCLGIIHGKLSTAGIEKVEKLGQLMGGTNEGCDFPLDSLELLNKIRAEASNKCSEKLRDDKPRVKIVKLITKDISAESAAESSVINDGNDENPQPMKKMRTCSQNKKPQIRGKSGAVEPSRGTLTQNKTLRADDTNLGGAAIIDHGTTVSASPTDENSPNAEILPTNAKLSDRADLSGKEMIYDVENTKPMKKKRTSVQNNGQETRGDQNVLAEMSYKCFWGLTDDQTNKCIEMFGLAEHQMHFEVGEGCTKRVVLKAGLVQIWKFQKCRSEFGIAPELEGLLRSLGDCNVVAIPIGWNATHPHATTKKIGVENANYAAILNGVHAHTMAKFKTHSNHAALLIYEKGNYTYIDKFKGESTNKYYHRIIGKLVEKLTKMGLQKNSFSSHIIKDPPA